ncbi:MAG: hypothetical protein DRI86_11570 [Bacteroidetes bacterium]|nr:MAG: hypothetical protein DRI86_11570 [Bacteroidota bacterium]
MKIFHIIIFFFLLGIVSCGSIKEDKLEANQMAAAPEWVKKRPVSQSNYIGIAKINKANYSDTYNQAAKKMALNDLASEISVKIESNTIVSSSEDNSGFKSDFSRYIQMEMQKDLEGYTLAGEYETSKMYMIYYQLSKSKWKTIQAQRKRAAAERAYSLYEHAQLKISSLEYKSAIKTLTNAILEIKKYWNEPVFYKINEENIRLDSEIRIQLTKILSELKLQTNNQTIILSPENNFKSELEIGVVNSNGDLLKGLPIRIAYRKTTMPYETTLYSELSPLKITLDNIKYNKKNTIVRVELEKEGVIVVSNEDKKLLKFIYDAFQVNPINVEVKFKLPRVFIKSNKSTNNTHYIKEAIAQSLGDKGFIMVDKTESADLVLICKTYENNKSDKNKVQIAYVSYSVDVRKKEDSSSIYTFSSDKYKGADYEFNSALEKSYIKIAEDIKNSSFEDLLETILN